MENLKSFKKFINKSSINEESASYWLDYAEDSEHHSNDELLEYCNNESELLEFYFKMVKIWLKETEDSEDNIGALGAIDIYLQDVLLTFRKLNKINGNMIHAMIMQH